VLYEPAEEWLEQQFKMLANGHCDGLALTSLAFWLGEPFEGKKTPADWQSGAQNVSDLKQSDALFNYVARIHALQSLAEVYDFRRENFKRKPSEILHLLMDSMKDDAEDRMELLIYLVIDGKLAKGHAIAPYAVEEMGDGEYHIHVYDSNYPGVSKYVELDAKEETWRYTRLPIQPRPRMTMSATLILTRCHCKIWVRANWKSTAVLFADSTRRLQGIMPAEVRSPPRLR
jgi:hypothetical protein